MNTDRLSLGWSLSDLAGEAGMSVASISRFFGGVYQSPRCAKKIAIALGYPLSRYVRDRRPEGAAA